MPERFATRRIKREKITRVIGGEEEMTSCSQDSLQAFAVTELSIPNDFASLVVEGAQSGVGPEISVATAPAFGFGFHRVVVNAEKAARHDVEKIRLRIEAGRH